ncbi:Isoleucine--tRNA ligase, cytoplasmic [Neolecta irregularis DAH-3]|uniref:Isoleucine--tRNA ligase, cytoplasmic n=1 Tax=Neolecta irregularis (strain DAH-3) TaxID=1198029 RepID=A0A1U7LJQ9_NEOID|nr:Isoleucine--tRNA ligase, cytoplasmic [Neolecta irregularis DAH-3]|eukprot:OLL22879.1 Isoleucine--tRNA ligase, cytoplasmic [Neolecta irregularis DAH-3]
MNFVKEEERILSYWTDIDAFQTSLKLNEDKPQFSFYDGPPFATGRPHYGHLLAGTMKDIVTRYAHTTGHSVDRRFGWDCHGLPVEHEIDKKLGIKGKDDVMAMGIDKYNAQCREIVMRYSGEWRITVERLGRWIDFDNDYKTLHPTFMESVWWVFKQLYEKDLVYRGYKVMPYSTGCTTPLSNFEAQQNYKDVVDPSVVVSFPLITDENTSLLAWTTTPWTLPSNVAVAVNPKFEYLKIRDDASGRNYIILEKRLVALYKDPKKAKFTIIERILGKDLEGLKYKPLFDYFVPTFGACGFKVIAADYVTDDSGTGLVHQAPAFGEDDYFAAEKAGIIDADHLPPCPIDESGLFTNEVHDFVGQYVKDADKPIQKRLKSEGRLIVQGQESHNYPFCWRSETPLLYRAIPAWFIKVKDHTERMLENLERTRWVPTFVQEGRFSNWIANARDWNISRNRYWGTPIPLWVSDDLEEIVCVGSIKELEELSGCGQLSDIHRESIDNITIPSKQGKGNLRRIEEVFDCCMPYASKHYPFSNKDKFEQSFPADFIAEGLDQTRGWFYTLLVLGTHLFDTAPFKNVIVNGIILAADGKKMSKKLKNYPDPAIVIDLYGSDALRLYLINSPVVRAESLKFKEEGVKEVVAKVLIPWWNSFNFLEQQIALLKKVANVDFEYNPSKGLSENVMDRWILASSASLIAFIKEEMSGYRLYTVVPRLLSLIDDLTSWYIRFNRRRFKGVHGVEDTMFALNTLFEVLFTLVRTMAPFTPFLTENIYQRLRKWLPTTATKGDVRSIHFLEFPQARADYLDEDVQRQVARMQNVISMGREIRNNKALAVKLPLRNMVVVHPDSTYLEDIRSLERYIKEELNIRELVLTSDEGKYGVIYSVQCDWGILGKKLRKDIGKVKAALPNLSSQNVKAFLAQGEIEVDGVQLIAGDLRVLRSVDSNVHPGHETATDDDVLIILDVTIHPDLQNEGLARELANRVQRLRKKASLEQTDDVRMIYRIIENPIRLEEILEEQKVFLMSIFRRPLEKLELDEAVPMNDLIAEEQAEIQGATFLLQLLKITE